MGKNKKNKSRKQIHSKADFLNTPIASHTSLNRKKNSLIDNIINLINSRKGIAFVGLVTIIGLVIILPDYFHKLSTSKHDLYIEQHTITGILIPDEILNSASDITYQISSGSSIRFPIKKVKEGIPFEINMFFCDEYPPPQQPINLRFVIKDKRLYVIDTIRYLLNDEVIGYINRNHWELINQQFLNYYSDDKIFEVIDKQGRIALSLSFLGGKNLYFKGYFISNDYVAVYGDSTFAPCFSKRESNYREKALELINTIKPLHNYNE